MAFDFTAKSSAELITLHADLRRIVIAAKAVSKVPFQISQGARTIDQQREYFKAGRSKVNPDAYATPEKLYAAAKHIVGPGAPLSRAVDMFTPDQPDGSYDVKALAYLAGVMDTCAAQLGINLRWGGNFDRDAAIVEPGTFQDLPHFELD